MYNERSLTKEIHMLSHIIRLGKSLGIDNYLLLGARQQGLDIVKLTFRVFSDIESNGFVVAN